MAQAPQSLVTSPAEDVAFVELNNHLHCRFLVAYAAQPSCIVMGQPDVLDLEAVRA
jgi:hypothetical protein